MKYRDPDSSSGGCSVAQLSACPVGASAHVLQVRYSVSSICSKDVECSPACSGCRSLSAAMVWSARRIVEGASVASS